MILKTHNGSTLNANDFFIAKERVKRQDTLKMLLEIEKEETLKQFEHQKAATGV
jgi:hypothetical protein